MFQKYLAIVSISFDLNECELQGPRNATLANYSVVNWYSDFFSGVLSRLHLLDDCPMERVYGRK
jgi:hypothetical protein